MMTRLETMILMGIDMPVRGEVKFNKLFEFAENAESNGLVLGELKATGNKLVNTQKMHFAGYGQEDNTMAG